MLCYQNSKLTFPDILDNDYTCFQHQFGLDFHAILLRCEIHEWTPFIIWTKNRSNFVSNFFHKKQFCSSPQCIKRLMCVCVLLECPLENCEECNANGTCVSCVNGTMLHNGNCSGGLNYHPFKWYHMACAIHNFYNRTDFISVKACIHTQTLFNFMTSHQ